MYLINIFSFSHVVSFSTAICAHQNGLKIVRISTMQIRILPERNSNRNQPYLNLNLPGNWIRLKIALILVVLYSDELSPSATS